VKYDKDGFFRGLIIIALQENPTFLEGWGITWVCGAEIGEAPGQVRGIRLNFRLFEDCGPSEYRNGNSLRIHSFNKVWKKLSSTIPYPINAFLPCISE